MSQRMRGVPHDRVEEALSNPPRPDPPDADLLRRLDADLALLSPGNHSPATSVWLRFLIKPGFAVPTICLLIALAFLLQQNASYSLATTIDALENVRSFRVVGMTRSGTATPEPHPASGSSTMHPDSPFVRFECWQVFRPGSTQLKQARLIRGERIRIFNFPLAVTHRLDGAGREVSLDTSFSAIGPHPNELLLRAAEGRPGEDFEIREVPGDPTRRLLVVHEESTRSEVRFWLDTRTWLPLRQEVWSGGFPGHDGMVLMSRMDYLDFGKEFEKELFEINVRDEELADLGIDRAFVENADPNTLVAELDGTRGRSYEIELIDQASTNRFVRRFPCRLFHAQQGDVTLVITPVADTPATIVIKANATELGGTGRKATIRIAKDGTVAGKFTPHP